MTHDTYLASLPDEQRVALETLRRTIRAAAPRAEECVSYGLPAFRLAGKVLVLFGASARHCSFFPGSGTAVAAHRDELEGYRTSKGTIRFDARKPLPAGLVRRIVKYRIAENAAPKGRVKTKGGKDARAAVDGRLARRVRALLGDRADLEELRMFGGLAFMIRGHMSCGIVGSSLMVRVEPAAAEEFLREPHARPMDFTGRPLRGFRSN